MTKIRRAAQVIEDLKTLRVITAEKVDSYAALNGGIMINIQVSKSNDIDDYYFYYLVRYAFEQEFSDDVKIIEDSNWLQFVLN